MSSEIFGGTRDNQTHYPVDASHGRRKSCRDCRREHEANGTLTIKGEKKQETEEKKENYYTSERRYGAFERSFQVPQDVDETKIEASFSKGLLTVTLPKRAEAQKLAKTIAVKAA